MKNKYLLRSAYARSDWDMMPALKDFLLSLGNVTEEIDEFGYNVLYITFSTFEDLEYVIEHIPEEVYEDISGWVPTDMLIDFKDKEIYLKDYYLE